MLSAQSYRKIKTKFSHRRHSTTYSTTAPDTNHKGQETLLHILNECHRYQSQSTGDTPPHTQRLPHIPITKDRRHSTTYSTTVPDANHKGQETLHHILIDCPRYQSQRTAMQQYQTLIGGPLTYPEMQDTRLNPNQVLTYQTIANYLKAIGKQQHI
ncbi:hypothetical protein CHS0354_015129 [Potamilus streckersoni]|uniref:Uncharacterized protein n=1 Tax=Potamilus streckersoni TaxID=2493646 RepID=A0AAE0VUH1_9BIVA|nr:hypothetical protein CHS0354_015129 [Potamilus streckersoni]